MTALLTRLLGRLPIGWLQLRHNRGRLLAALAGVAFANILIFMQLGFLGALVTATKQPYGLIRADAMISGADGSTLTDGGDTPRRRLYQALAAPEVARAEPLYIGRLEWTQPSGDTAIFIVFGAPPGGRMFAPELIEKAERAGRSIKLLDTVLIDEKTRGLDASVVEKLASGHPFDMEVRGRSLRVGGVFTLGGGFESDGYLLVSDETFLKLFPQRVAGAPSHILLEAAEGVTTEALVAAVTARLNDDETKTRSVTAAADRDADYQTTEKPVGIIFGFGVIIGVLVGVIIVYQVLSTDVADHLAEYATLKAVGYSQGFFLSIVFEQAVLLAVLGFVPGILFVFGFYALVAEATLLPIAMTVPRAVAVFFGILVMCMVSGALATRRLAQADPADLF